MSTKAGLGQRMLATLSGGAAAAAPLRATGARTRAVRVQCVRASAAKGSSVSERVSAALRGTAVFVVGDNSAANVKLCDALAATLGCAWRSRRAARGADVCGAARYAPLHTEQLLSRLTGQSLADIERADGPAGVALAEAMVLEEISSVARCCVATIGAARGAAARGDCWRHLFGGITIWLGARLAPRVLSRVLSRPRRPDERCNSEGLQREAYALAEVTVRSRPGQPSAGRARAASQQSNRAQVDASKLDALSGAELADRTLPALDKLLSAEKDLVGKKSLYVRLGSRGDWCVRRETAHRRGLAEVFSAVAGLTWRSLGPQCRRCTETCDV